MITVLRYLSLCSGIEAASVAWRPLECERLQGFPDYYTDIKFRGRPAADSPRYKALGNSMAVPVMRWIGKRIAMISEQNTQKKSSKFCPDFEAKAAP